MTLEKEIRKKAKKAIIYTSHATVQINLEERLITTQEVREVINKGEIIEKREDDLRGKTYLLSGKTQKDRVIHVVCSPKDDYLAIVTAYKPDPEKWDKTLTKRKEN